MRKVIVAKPIEDYLDSLLPKRDTLLAEMERVARRDDIPILGPTCARLLALLVQVAGARRIFEMGSAIGYTTIWLARAAGAHAEVHYTDSDSACIRAARGYFRRAGVNRRIRLHEGDAVQAMEESKGQFDMVFCDLDKDQYPAALRAALPHLRSGGLFVADNVLWHGLVAKPGKDNETRAVRQMNRMLYRTRDLFSVIVPMRDGMSISVKR